MFIYVYFFERIWANSAKITPREESDKKEYIEKFEILIEINKLKINPIIPAPEPSEINNLPKLTFFFRTKNPPIRTASAPKEATINRRTKIKLINSKLKYFKIISSSSIQLATPVVPESNNNSEDKIAKTNAGRFLFFIFFVM